MHVAIIPQKEGSCLTQHSCTCPMTSPSFSTDTKNGHSRTHASSPSQDPTLSQACTGGAWDYGTGINVLMTHRCQIETCIMWSIILNNLAGQFIKVTCIATTSTLRPNVSGPRVTRIGRFDCMLFQHEFEQTTRGGSTPVSCLTFSHTYVHMCNAVIVVWVLQLASLIIKLGTIMHQVCQEGCIWIKFQ